MVTIIKRLPLIWKIFLPLGFVVLLGAAVSLVLLSGADESEHFLRELYENNMQYNLHLSNLDKLIIEHHMLLLEHVAAESAGQLRDLDGRIDEVKVNVGRIFKEHSRQHSTKYFHSTMLLGKLYEKYQAEGGEVVGLSRDFEKEKAFKHLQIEAAPLLRQISDIIYKQRVAADKMMENFYQQAARSQKTNTILAWFFVIVSIVVPVLIAVFLARYFSGQMNGIIAYAREIGSGNLGATLVVTAEDEFGRLGDSLKTMGGSLSSSFRKLQAVNQQLATQATALEKSEALLRLRQQELEMSNKSLQKIQSTVNELLLMALEALPLDELVQRFIVLITPLPELNLTDKGAVFLVEDDPDLLVLKGFNNFPTSLCQTAKTVPAGQCLCGRSAQDGRFHFADGGDGKHHTIYDSVYPHGHYCIPVTTPEKESRGFFVVALAAGAECSTQVENFLMATASILGVIIENRMTYEKSQESDEKYRVITNTANDAIIMMNDLGETIFWNPAAERIFGYSREEVLGRKMSRLIFSEKDCGRSQSDFEKFMRIGQRDAIGETIEISGLRKDGSEFPAEISLSVVNIKKKRAVAGLVRDISERKNAEAERAKLQTQLRQAQKMQAIGTLAGGIAHDFNNILSAILGYGELVQEAVHDDPEISGDVEQIMKAGNRAKKLVRQILTFSRQNEQEIIPVQTGLVVKEALKLLRASIPANIAIKQQINIEETTVYADPTQIHQVVMNLCTNAFQAMRDGGILEIILDDEQPGSEILQAHPDMKSGSFLCLHVIDSGCGMDRDTMLQIFDPYFSTRKKEDGTGLGLSIVHGIVAHLGGAIIVDSKVGAGTAFSVYLPLAVVS